MIKRIFKAIIRRAVWGFCYLLPVKRNKIVISSYYGRGYGDNPKYIVEELFRRKEKLDIVWLVKNEKEAATLPKGIRTAIFGSNHAIYHLSTAKVWIDNCRKAYIFKKKKQYYMQTWHGFALKRIEKDVADTFPPYYIKEAIKDSKGIDIIVSDSTFMTKIYKESFWYDGEVCEWGAPRNDGIIKGSESVSKKVRDSLNLQENKKIVLYAPTFRVDYSTECYDIAYERLIDACNKRFDGDFIVLVRLHPNVVSKCSNIPFSENVINATFYPDMQELLEVADIVISDYSSLMFDFSIMLKPCFQFATDIEDYKKDRNFYFQIDMLPFSLCKNNDELIEAVLSFDKEKYEAELLGFLKDVGMVRDGLASERCADWIADVINR